MTHRFLPLFALLSAGCAGIDLTQTIVKPPTLPTVTGTRWAQYCTFNGTTDLEEINRFLSSQGKRGWELVSVAGRQATIYCFKAPL